VLGIPTYEELSDLVAVQRFNLAQLDSVKACPAWASKDPTGYGAWAGQVADATTKMTSVLDAADATLAAVPSALHALPINSMGTTSPWDDILAAAVPFHGLVATFMAQSGCPWPPGSPPQPTAPDFDLKVYQWTGKALSAVSFGGSLGLILLGAFLLFGQRGSR
jgi:hypothetical protein